MLDEVAGLGEKLDTAKNELVDVQQQMDSILMGIPNPLHGIYAAVTRQDTTGWPEGGWQPQEKVSLDEALKMFTEWAAYGAMLEDVQGRIAPGYYADFTVVSHPFDEKSPTSILTAEILFTIVNGKIVYKK
ncbi:MAG: amidohydrolase family protein [Simkaniaceae bacterium]|nr:amidohydrolase family protein [Simkaniaceae bacterium]